MVGRVLICPDKLKGCLTAAAAAALIAEALGEVWPGVACDRLPLADGGEGTLEVLAAARGEGVWRQTRVAGPHGEAVDARWWLGADGVAVVESAEASGLARTHLRVPGAACSGARASCCARRRRRGRATSCSAWVAARWWTAARGPCARWAARCSTRAGARFRRGRLLVRLAQMVPAPFTVPITVLCDVQAPLVGPAGAARVYGPQKGASPGEVAVLEAGLARLGQVLADQGRDPRAVAGAGAAGGLAGGLWGALGAILASGFDVVAEAVGLDARVAAADLVITAEGQLDAQTAQGKVVSGVVRRASGRPVWVLAGAVTAAGEAALGPGVAVVPLAEGPGTLAEALAEAPARLGRATRRAARLYALGASAGGRASAMARMVQ
ncbi:MAG: glycerate kinase [bacterium]